MPFQISILRQNPAKVVEEAPRQTPILGEYDVVIAGGGTAGAIAAIAAARNGAKTLVVEQFGFLGGTATAGLVTPMMNAQVKGAPLATGLSTEVNARLLAMGEAGVDPANGHDGWFNPEGLKLVLQELALEAGVELLFHAMVASPVVDGRAVRGLIIESKSGRQAVLAKVTIDATGDGDVAARAGSPFDHGAPTGSENQAMSLRFQLGNVDMRRFVSHLNALRRGAALGTAIPGPAGPPAVNAPRYAPLFSAAMIWDTASPLEPAFRQAVTDGVLREEDGNYFQVFAVPGRPGELSFNCPRIFDHVNGTDARDLTHAQVVGRQAVRRLLEFCRRYLPGCENSYVVAVAPMVGVRESRRIIGDYVLTIEDILAARKFADAVARNNYPVDIHASRRKIPGVTMANHLGLDDYYEVPYRCLLPRTLENLLVAGRCLSATFDAQSSVRIQLPLRAIGQAAGTAAAIAAKQGVTPRQVKGEALRQVLTAQGMNL